MGSLAGAILTDGWHRVYTWGAAGVITLAERLLSGKRGYRCRQLAEYGRPSGARQRRHSGFVISSS
jgi:hypothetical protein